MLAAQEHFHSAKQGQARSLIRKVMSANAGAMRKGGVSAHLRFLRKKRIQHLRTRIDPRAGWFGPSNCRYGPCDLTNTGIRSLGGECVWIEFVAWVAEGRMVEDVVRIHPNLDFASLPSRHTQTLGQ